ncbi:MAG: MATE family efflux transporter [Ignavibacteriales bacterium]
MMDNITRQLGEEKISKLLWQFSIPAIISTLASSVYIIIDRIFVGQVVGADAISGMSITMPISFVIMAFGMLVGMGSGALVSIRLGQGKREQAEVILGNAFTMLLIISVVVTGVLLYYLDPLLALFGASPAILPYGRQFISIVLMGSVFQYIGFGLSTVMRAEGNPRKAMNVVLINTGTNIILDFLFIYIFHWGIRGAAIATIMAQAVSAVLILVHFRSGKSVLHLHLSNMRLNPKVMRGVAAIGMAPFAMQMAASLVNTLFNKDLARYGGDAAIGAYGIIGAIIMFIIMPIIGINMGAQPIIGFNYGARRYDRVLETLRKAIIAASAVVCSGFILLELFPRQFMIFFTNDASMVTIGTHGIRIIVLMLPVVGFQIVSGHFFQAIGKAPRALVLTLLRQVIILIPALLLLPRYFQLNGIWFSAPLADGLSTLVTLLVLLPEVNYLKTKWQESKQDHNENVMPSH